MKISHILLGASTFLVPFASLAQDYSADALRFSQQSLISGTARYQGLGGAQTALGADVGSLSGNPAGLGFFRKSEFSISTGLGSANTSTNYINTSTNDSKLNFNLNNLGIVFSSTKDDIVPGSWRGGSFGISFTRQNNFQNQFSYDAVNNRSSFLDNLTERARGAYPNLDLGSNFNSLGQAPSLESAAYSVYLINPLAPPGDTTEYYRLNDERFNDNGNLAVGVRQRETFNSTGAQNQWNFSYGGNFADKFYFGASLGITSLRYGYKLSRAETYQYPSDYEQNGYQKQIQSFTYDEQLSVRGTGVNFSAGLIYRPNDIIRFGASLITPTFYNLSEEFNSTITPYYYNNSVLLLPSGNVSLGNNTGKPLSVIPYTFKYSLATPWRASGGLAFFFGKRGFISADAEYVTYSSMSLGTSAYSSGADNANFKSTNKQTIESIYQPVVNVKVGGEFRHGILRLRAGFGYQADPYKPGVVDDVDRTRLNFSVGAGVHLQNYYLDLAAVHTRYKSGYTPYTLQDSRNYASATIQNQFTNAVLTFGTFF